MRNLWHRLRTLPPQTIALPPEQADRLARMKLPSC